jgi:hypothetical protein
MDTRFWGPSAWKLLHYITLDFEYSASHAITYARFFDTIPYVLPCKFCRSSLTDYYRLHPFQLANSAIDPSCNLTKWLYTIHNCVNDKLRSQGIPTPANPSFRYVMQLYRSPPKMSMFWDFLFSVAYHYPKYVKPEPMPHCPKGITDADACDKNKWNVLPAKERMKWYIAFWTYLPDVLPLSVRSQWKRVPLKPDVRSRQGMLQWLWKMRCVMDSQFTDPYHSVCRHIKSFSSDCKRSVTCRAKRSDSKRK